MRRGDTAPEFTGVDQTGTEVRLSELLKTGPVVLFFFPKAFSPGCTIEACHFRDLAEEFAEFGAHRIGISTDRVEKQAEFVDKHELGYPVLSDPDRAITRKYGVKRPGPLLPKRSTFVIDVSGTVVDVISSEIDMNAHADSALTVLRGLTSDS